MNIAKKLSTVAMATAVAALMSLAQLQQKISKSPLAIVVAVAKRQLVLASKKHLKSFLAASTRQHCF